MAVFRGRHTVKIMDLWMTVGMDSGERNRAMVAEALNRMGSGAYELVERERRSRSDIYHEGALASLREADEQVYELIEREYERLGSTLQLIAAENQCSQAVLAALGSVIQNKTTEGFIGARYHGGSEVADGVEWLACERAKVAFKARYANVQPHSGTSANQIVMTALLERDDRVLSLSMDQGGHVSHGEPVALSGKFFEVANYGVDRETLRLDYEAIRQLALKIRPRLLICGGSAYCRQIDFAKFREIADEVGAYLMADVSHIASLIVGGEHPSCVDHAHFTTTSTYKPGGPRGGLIVMGRDYEQPVKVGSGEIPLWKLIERTTFPGLQGTPCLNNIAGKAVFFREMTDLAYVERQAHVVANAKRLAQCMIERGYDVVTGGTDTHMVLVNVRNSREGLTGVISQRALEDCGIVVNMNRLPYDTFGPRVTSGMRLGTPIVTRNGMGPREMETVADMVNEVLRRVEILGEREYALDGAFINEMRDRVRSLCRLFPIS